MSRSQRPVFLEQINRLDHRFHEVADFFTVGFEIASFDDKAVLREGGFAFHQVDERLHAELSHRDRCLGLIEHQAMDHAFGERRQLCGCAAHLDNCDILGIDAELFQRDQERHVIGCAEATDGENLAFKVGGSFYLRTNDELRRKKIEPAGDERQVGLLQIGRDHGNAG